MSATNREKATAVLAAKLDKAKFSPSLLDCEILAEEMADELSKAGLLALDPIGDLPSGKANTILTLDADTSVTPVGPCEPSPPKEG